MLGIIYVFFSLDLPPSSKIRRWIILCFRRFRRRKINHIKSCLGQRQEYCGRLWPRCPSVGEWRVRAVVFVCIVISLHHSLGGFTHTIPTQTLAKGNVSIFLLLSPFVTRVSSGRAALLWFPSFSLRLLLLHARLVVSPDAACLMPRDAGVLSHASNF